MKHAKARRRAVGDSYEKGLTALAGLLVENRDLLEGLVGLRALGSKADLAVDQVLAVQEVRRLKLGWELLAALVAGDGLHPDALLLDFVPHELLDLGREALWGGEADDGGPA